MPDSVIPFPNAAREQPVDVEAEQALLGALLVEPAAYRHIDGLLQPQHFSNAVHGRIFNAFGVLVAAGAHPDAVVVKDALGSEPLLNAVGGIGTFIAALIRGAGVPSNIAFYAKAIRDTYSRRCAIATATTVIESANNPSARLDRTISQAVSELSHTAGPPALTLTCAADMAATAPPERPWIVSGWLPSRQVTLLTGDGGTGKSQIAMQLQAAASAGMRWLGLPVVACRSIGLYAEDDQDELHRRLHGIMDLTGISAAALSMMHWRSVIGDDAEMVEVDAGGTLVATAYFRDLERIVLSCGARLLVLDAITNLFGGDEIRRRQVNAFILLLRQLAIKMDGAVLLLGHPSASGIATGSGLSGSTHWHNAVRSRFYFERASGEDADPNERTLSKLKANYAGSGDVLRVRWQPGGFIGLDEPGSLDRAAQNAKADRVFRALLAASYAEGAWTSSNPMAKNYAPSAFAKRPDREGLGKRALEDALHRLKHAGGVKTERYGRPSNQHWRLVLA